MGKTVPLSTLRRGRVFWSCGEKYRLVYKNACRAYVELVRGEVVSIKGRRFRRPVYYNFAPMSEVEIRG